MSKENYREVAAKLGVKYLFGRWGLLWFPRLPEGHIQNLVRIVPLDGWITDPKEIESAVGLDDDFTVRAESTTTTERSE